MPKTPQLANFNAKKQQLYSELPLDVQVPHLISEAKYNHPLALQKLHLQYTHKKIMQ